MDLTIGKETIHIDEEQITNVDVTHSKIGQYDFALLTPKGFDRIKAINDLVVKVYTEYTGEIECPPNTYPVISTIPGHRGFILLPQSPSGRLFVDYFQKEKKHVKDETVPIVFDKLYLMGMFIIEWHIEGISDPQHFLENPLDYSASLPYFIWDAVQGLLQRVTTLKN